MKIFVGMTHNFCDVGTASRLLFAAQTKQTAAEEMLKHFKLMAEDNEEYLEELQAALEDWLEDETLLSIEIFDDEQVHYIECMELK